ncbi:helix-turn-helix domain-containing protein [Kribbella sp. CA-294648]|uniref:helix-turn-helix domain-containing protein n=1 Tax=Kribbella sp. CA-294648 TaxID=3239948 RepID=UPI003D8D17CD
MAVSKSNRSATSGRASTPVKVRKKPARGLTHKTPSRGRRPSDDRQTHEELVVPVATPSRALVRELDLVLSQGAEVTIFQGKNSVKVTGETLAAIRQMIAALSAGPVSLIIGDARDTELTSQEVADLLNVSRPYVVKLAREGQIAHKMVGNRHRFLLSDVQAFEHDRRVEREQALAAMTPDDGYTDGDF